MKASEVYQRFIEEYRKVNIIPENNAIEDGDMLDFICARVANNYFSNPFVMRSLSHNEMCDWLDANGYVIENSREYIYRKGNKTFHIDELIKLANEEAGRQ